MTVGESALDRREKSSRGKVAFCNCLHSPVKARFRGGNGRREPHDLFDLDGGIVDDTTERSNKCRGILIR